MSAVLRVRPTVMISSTIGELFAERDAISKELDREAFADGWLFEIHAPAAGAPAEERYLAIAASCDVYVLVVADDYSQPTEAEYHAAFDDNPRKVLPFFVGPPSPSTQQLRSLIESRHVRVQVSSKADLPRAVVKAVRDAVHHGDITRPALLERLLTAIAGAEQVAGRSIPLDFIPVVAPLERPDDGVMANIKSNLPTHVVFEGIGGSGKTFAALVLALSAGRSSELPLVILPSAGVFRLAELILAAFERVRFFPGDALVHQLARDGKLCLVADGVDALSPSARREFMTELNDFAERFPRVRIVACVRRRAPSELPAFESYTVSPLTWQQTADSFDALNKPRIAAFPPQVADLAQWPLWAWGLVEVGPTVKTGLQLLGSLVERRVTAAGVASPIEAAMLMEGAAAVAYALWPEPSGAATAAVDAIASWSQEPTVSTRFSVGSADALLTRLSATGLVRLDTDVTFAHPLFATFLAATHAARSEADSKLDGNAEAAMFVAALTPGPQAGRRLRLLALHGPIGQARFLRLVTAQRREVRPDDPIRFGEALQSLDESAAECIVTPQWTAWRKAERPRIGAPTEIANWLASGEVCFMVGNVFADRTPIEVAAIESVARYKTRMMRLEPKDRSSVEIGVVSPIEFRRLPRTQQDATLLQVMREWRQDWRGLAEAMGIAHLPEAAVPDGDPQVTLIGTQLDPLVDVRWGAGASVSRSHTTDQMWRYRPLSHYIGVDRHLGVYNELRQIAEQILGCTLASQTWTRPELVSSWAW